MIRNVTTPCIILSLLILLTSCSASLRDYKGTSPDFVMEQFLEGELIARGMIQDYTGKVTRRFCVDIAGEWQEAQNGRLHGTVKEIFYYDDGEQDQRIWQIEKQQKDGKAIYTGTAGDVIGTAQGQSQGYAFYWEYTLEVPIRSDDGEENLYQFKIKDWIYQLDENHAINRSALKKFGIEVGQLTIYFDKTVAACSEAG